MLRVLFVFFILLASVCLGIYLQNDPGYVLIAVDKWTIETTLWVAMIALVLSFIALYCFTSIASWALHIPSSYRRWKADRIKRKARAKTRQGLIEFSEGYWNKAKSHLIKALPGTDTPLLNYLTAARAAQEMGDSKLRDDYLREAQQSMPEAKIAVELTQAQLQLANQQWEQALATLQHLHHLTPSHPYVLKLLMKLYKQVRDWPQLIALLPELKRNQVVTRIEYDHLKQYVYLQSMKDYLKHNQHEALEASFESRPHALLYDPEIIALYCSYLIGKEDYVLAETLLRRTLSKGFSEPLMSLYGQLNNHGAKLNFAESFLKEQPHSPILLLCLGKICEAKNLWGKAREYFENSISYGAIPDAYLALGHLLQLLNDQTNACEAYRKGLELAQSNHT